MLRVRWAIAVGAVLALLLGGCGGAGGDGTEADTGTGSGAQFRSAEVAAALSRGPFTQPLSSGLRVKELRRIEVADRSAAKRVGAVELVVDTGKAPPHTAVSAHLELYPNPRAAVERSRAQIGLLERKDAKVVGGPLSYCAPTTLHGRRAWECGGADGSVYVEATVAPRGNAPPHTERSRSLAIGLMSALISYAKEKGA